MRVRTEWFGGLVAHDAPDAPGALPSLVGVNRAAMRALGVASSARWRGPDPGKLSAPIEVQLLLSLRCSAGCPTCSVDAVPDGPELSLARGRALLDDFARRGVFTVAFGGGEPLEHPDVFTLAEHARSLGLWVTMTTSGLIHGATLDAACAARCRVFHAVHVSLEPGGARALAAIHALQGPGDGPAVGINVVVEHGRLERVARALAIARERRLTAVQIVRFKAAGRARADDAARGPRAEDLRTLTSWVEHAVRDGVRVRVDCSLAPLFPRVDARPTAGATLTVMPDGRESACVVEHGALVSISPRRP